MSLVKCNECGNNVSTNALSCPHCGNRFFMDNSNSNRIIEAKEEKTTVIRKQKVNNLKILSFSFLILAFITTFFEVAFSKSWWYYGNPYSYTDTSKYGSWNINFLDKDISEKIFKNYDTLFLIVGIIAIISLLALFIICLIKKLNVVKKYKWSFYIPTFIYTIMALIIALVGLKSDGNPTGKMYLEFDLAWGGIWIIMLLLASTILLIIDLVKVKEK